MRPRGGCRVLNALNHKGTKARRRLTPYSPDTRVSFLSLCLCGGESGCGLRPRLALLRRARRSRARRPRPQNCRSGDRRSQSKPSAASYLGGMRSIPTPRRSRAYLTGGPQQACSAALRFHPHLRLPFPAPPPFSPRSPNFLPPSFSSSRPKLLCPARRGWIFMQHGDGPKTGAPGGAPTPWCELRRRQECRRYWRGTDSAGGAEPAATGLC